MRVFTKCRHLRSQLTFKGLQRLESSAPKQGVMISESTYNLVRDHILVGERQEIEVKGKNEKVAAYVLEGLK